MARKKFATDLNVIKSDIDTCPDGADETGEWVDWGGRKRKVFVENKEISELRPITDPQTGGPMYKRGAGGVTLNAKHTERVVLEVQRREFIQVDQGNGIVTKLYAFREDPKEVERKEKVARRQKNLEKLLDIAEEAGGIDKLLAAADEPPKKQKKVAA